MSLDCGRKPEYPEKPTLTRGEHANSTERPRPGIRTETFLLENMSCYEVEKKDSMEGACCAAGLSGCAAAMEKERESGLSFTDSSSGTLTSTSSQQGGDQSDLQGYDVDFDPPLESKYECPICLMALRAAVQTTCGHRFCRACIEKSIRDAGQKCPVDNEVLTEDQLFPDNFAKREILSLTVRCPNAGCDHKMELRHLEAHVAQCQFATVQCPLCQDAVWKSELEEHKTQRCPRRYVSCTDCMQKFVFEDRKVHEQLCPLANVVCEYCSMELIRDQLASHCDTDCLTAPVACTFSFFGCQERMRRNDLAQHMQEFTQMHMRNMAERGVLRGRGRGGASSSSSLPCACGPQLQHMRETTQQLEARLVRQDHQLRELSIHSETQATQLSELRKQVRTLDDTVRELAAQQCQGVFVWRVEGFSAHLRNQESGQPVVIHSPGFYTGRPGYKLCLRLHLQTPSAPRCSNYISLFVHTMQGEFDGQLSWPFQGSIRLAILDQADGQHHVEVMETKPDLLAFQRPTSQRNPKGFGYVTFLHLHALQQGHFVKDDTLLVRCEVTARFDSCVRREGFQPRGPEPSLLKQWKAFPVGEGIRVQIRICKAPYVLQSGGKSTPPPPLAGRGTAELSRRLLPGEHHHVYRGLQHVGLAGEGPGATNSAPSPGPPSPTVFTPQVHHAGHRQQLQVRVGVGNRVASHPTSLLQVSLALLLHQGCQRAVVGGVLGDQNLGLLAEVRHRPRRPGACRTAFWGKRKIRTSSICVMAGGGGDGAVGNSSSNESFSRTRSLNPSKAICLTVSSWPCHHTTTQISRQVFPVLPPPLPLCNPPSPRLLPHHFSKTSCANAARYPPKQRREERGGQGITQFHPGNELAPDAGIHGHIERWSAHLFQTLALDSCRAGELAWKRGRSVSTGELMKRGRGRRNEPITAFLASPHRNVPQRSTGWFCPVLTGPDHRPLYSRAMGTFHPVSRRRRKKKKSSDRSMLEHLQTSGLDTLRDPQPSRTAPSKDAVRQLCQDSFPSGAPESQQLAESAAGTLSVSASEAQQLLKALHTLSHHILFHSLTAPEPILALFPDSFHPSLKNLITKILLEHSPVWRNEALASQISLPQLVDMDWRVDMKTASDSVSRMAVPTCLVHMKVQDPLALGGGDPVSTVTVELSRETLDTMLDGLGRIRDQLSVVASK
ncbi:hypothetical protein AAFF_G00282330 [Aldrovandia affinis]|uniref:RING-type E3 ubiquitin transferase n=1 Tax=Aldrovandia affinis TaxID=143900 RepID=A0AAD7TBC8_9TELE|nr:hypothetical protein AAFF_G00282330 [Aldrovandia affinis]